MPSRLTESKLLCEKPRFPGSHVMASKTGVATLCTLLIGKPPQARRSFGTKCPQTPLVCGTDAKAPVQGTPLVREAAQPVNFALYGHRLPRFLLRGAVFRTELLFYKLPVIALSFSIFRRPLPCSPRKRRRPCARQPRRAKNVKLGLAIVPALC